MGPLPNGHEHGFYMGVIVTTEPSPGMILQVQQGPFQQFHRRDISPHVSTLDSSPQLEARITFGICIHVSNRSLGPTIVNGECFGGS